ncbi:alpha/beta fold hydrolase [Streptomyces fagopyri]|uniref:alpha/beta fold hydrolase n=1 Tax=Streptomyces fagopyri TaxID=2662397 RepID=UPI001885A6B5|nr:alpha/beta hydrolase [Streptomyces fagopyri]
MHTSPKRRGSLVLTLAAATTVALAAAGSADAVPAHAAVHHATTKPTIVLVHGAWADASSFAPVAHKLQRDGYTVLDAPNPLRGLAADSASVAAFVNQATTGSVVLVGHSYGGAVITNAAAGISRVRALSYIDAYAPAQGESVAQLTGAKPGSLLAVADPSTVFDAVQDPSQPQGDPDLYVKRDLFPKAFAGSLPARVGAELAAAQTPIAAGALNEQSGPAAWKTVPSWFLVGTKDEVLPPAEQRAMAARAHGTVVTADADHLSMLEVPSAVTKLIEEAGTSTGGAR